jgi:hypothetical protein
LGKEPALLLRQVGRTEFHQAALDFRICIRNSRDLAGKVIIPLKECALRKAGRVGADEAEQKFPRLPGVNGCDCIQPRFTKMVHLVLNLFRSLSDTVVLEDGVAAVEAEDDEAERAGGQALDERLERFGQGADIAFIEFGPAGDEGSGVEEDDDPGTVPRQDWGRRPDGIDGSDGSRG